MSAFNTVWYKTNDAMGALVDGFKCCAVIRQILPLNLLFVATDQWTKTKFSYAGVK